MQPQNSVTCAKMEDYESNMGGKQKCWGIFAKDNTGEQYHKR